MKRASVAVLLLALAGAAALWLTRGGVRGPEVGDGPTADGASADAPDLVEGALLGHKGGPAPTKAAAVGRSAIVGTVRRGAAPVAAKVEVRKVQDVGNVSVFGRYGARFFDRLLLRPNATLDVLGTARAGDDGRFAVEGLSPGVYEVTAVADDGARGGATATLPVEGARVEANPVVAGGNETLKGRVVHADGRPWQGPVLLLDALATNPGYDPGGLRGVVLALDAEGRFSAGGLAAGPVHLTAIAAESFRATSRPVTLPYAGEYLFVVDAGLTAFKGRVVADADGSPVAGAIVMAGGRGGELTVVATRTQTDADGRFELQVTQVEGWGAGITADGFAPVFLQRVETSGKEPVEIRLVKAATLKGRVTRAGDGTPAAGLSVRVVPIGDVQTYTGGGTGTTDADGRYEIPALAAGEAAAFAEGPGWISKGIQLFDDRGYNPLAITLTAGETTVADLVVVPGARAEGTALDAAGAPVAGALVTPQPGGNAPRTLRQFGFGTTPAATGPDGRFVLDALTPGTAYSFTAQAPGYALVTVGPLVTTEGNPIAVDIRFGAPRFLDVTVLDDASGAPIPGARVNSGSGVQAFTGVDGKARVGPLPAEQRSLRVDADGYVGLGRAGDLQTAEGESTKVVRLRKGLELSGRVLDADRAPVSGATVELQPLGQDISAWVSPVVTNADGSFRFRGLPALKYGVNAWTRADGKSRSGSATASSGAADVVVALGPSAGSDPLGTLLVRAVDPAGKPVLRASVRFSAANSTSNTSISEGVARLNLGPNRGAGAVEVWGARGMDGSLLPLGPTKVPVPVDVNEVVVPLPPEVRIDGVVRSPDGAPVQGVVVAAVPKDRVQEYAWSRSGVSRSRTDASGTFHLGGLAAQDYLLQIQVPPEFVTPEPLPMVGDAANVEIRLEAGLTVAITVLDADGKPVSGATVRADTDDRGLPEGMNGRMFPRADVSGVALLTGLAHDRAYRLQVASTRTDVFPEDRSDWHPRDETVRLGRAYVVKGIVRDTQGRPVPNAWVHRQVSENNWNGTSTGPDGTFTIPQVPAGNVVLRPGLEGMEENAPEVTVAAGASNVVLVLDIGLELTVRIDNWPSGVPPWLQVQFATRRGDQRSNRSASPAAGGVFTFRGLHADDVCSLFVPPVGDGLSLLLRDLKPGRDVRAHLEPGKTITGRLRLPPGVTNVQANASLDDFAYLNATMEAEGRFTFRGAVDGTWKVNASANTSGGATPLSASGEVVAGGSIDLELKPATR